jgi:hypothetical protein
MPPVPVMLLHQSASLIQQTKTRVAGAGLHAEGDLETVSGYSRSKLQSYGGAVFNEVLERAKQAAQNPKCLVILVADECHWGAGRGGDGDGDTEAANNAVCPLLKCESCNGSGCKLPRRSRVPVLPVLPLFLCRS